MGLGYLFGRVVQLSLGQALGLGDGFRRGRGHGTQAGDRGGSTGTPGVVASDRPASADGGQHPVAHPAGPGDSDAESEAGKMSALFAWAI
jgi:hypothetical protein